MVLGDIVVIVLVAVGDILLLLALVYALSDSKLDKYQKSLLTFFYGLIIILFTGLFYALQEGLL